MAPHKSVAASRHSRPAESVRRSDAWRYVLAVSRQSSSSIHLTVRQKPGVPEYTVLVLPDNYRLLMPQVRAECPGAKTTALLLAYLRQPAMHKVPQSIASNTCFRKRLRLSGPAGLVSLYPLVS